MDETVLSFLVLCSIEGLGCRGIHRLLEQFRTPEAVLSSPLPQLLSAGVPECLAREFPSNARKSQAESIWLRCQQEKVEILTFNDPAYPRPLKEIYDPPLVLYLKGDKSCLDEPIIAIVGSRHASPYGINVSEQLARDLSRRGIIIVSGLARGIDSAAHRGALEGKGKTIAVLGSGIDVIYPRENRRLAQQIEASGCLISEYPLGTAPTPQNFPVRNRIISGLALGTCVVEAAEFSGSLITARVALEQGREVFAVPGNITSRNSFGPNLWIKQGAKLVQDWRDVVEELPLPVKQQISTLSEGSENPQQQGLFDQILTAEEKRVLELLSTDQPVHIDQLLETTQMNSSELLAALSELEMKDIIKQLRGKFFLRKLF
jgi:DNA processing protein